MPPFVGTVSHSHRGEHHLPIVSPSHHAPLYHATNHQRWVVVVTCIWATGPSTRIMVMSAAATQASRCRIRTELTPAEGRAATAATLPGGTRQRLRMADQLSLNWSSAKIPVGIYTFTRIRTASAPAPAPAPARHRECHSPLPLCVTNRPRQSQQRVLEVRRNYQLRRG